MERFFQENPEEQQRTYEFAALMRETAERYLNTSSILKDASVQVTIPVVFHVLYSNARPELKITAAKAAAEINYINQWYSASNTNYAKTNSYWTSVRATAADFKISFAIATKDPSGNPTTGIIYHESSVVNTCGATEIFQTSAGGADAWNTLQYMNIWTCPLTSGAAGYAYLPGSGTHYRDGVVMDPQYIGYDYASGSLVAHEAGHWLGLPHTFTGSANTCTNSDNVADTPITDVNAWDYVSYQVCTNPAGYNAADFQRCNNIVMIQNNMDYNYEECKSFFSKGQVAVMRSYLDTPSSVRGGIKTSPALGSQACTPNCAGKVCGSNGCGGTCGTCLSTSVCSADQTTCGAAGSSPSASPSPIPASPSATPTRSPVAAASASPTSSPVAAASASPSPVPSASPSPSSAAQSGTSEATRNLVVQKINTVRAQVSPPAITPLSNLTYSVSLETQAKTHAQGCSLQVFIGQTGAAYYGDQTADLSFIFGDAIATWNASKPNYHLTGSGSTCSDPNTCQFYVQLIWNNANYPTTQVGCGAAYCSADDLTFVVCQFSGAGNQAGQLPYVPCETAECNPSCNAVCSPEQCGIIQTACGAIDCGPCCDDPCSVNQCGSHLNSCGTTITCPSCPAGSTCTAGGAGTTCVTDPVCVHADECAAGGFECGSKVFCGVNQACGYCGSGEICSDFQCVADPCNNCGPYSQCVNQQCSCLSGYVLTNGVCTMPSLSIDYTNMFQQTLPAGSADFVIPQNDLILTGSGAHILKWSSSADVMDLYTTKSIITVSIASGEFGFNIRHGQSGSSRANDRLMWHVKDIGSSPTLAICLVYYGNNYCSGYSPISFPNPANVTVTMGYDGAGTILTSWKVNNDFPWSSSTSQSYFPALGAVSYFLSSSANPILSDAILATSSTLTVSLTECISDAQWSAMFYALTGANPATTSVTVRPSGTSGNCKGAGEGKIIASGFTVVLTSTAVPAAALASQLTTTVGSPAAAAFGLSSASVVSGTAGATAAGFPTTIAALGGTTVVAPAVGGGGGGGGGAAGLSGGAIAGIVIGSVAGAVLIVGVTAVVVAAVIVAAVVVAKKSGSDSESSLSSDQGPSRSEPRSSRRIRDTLYDIFRAPKGGVDVMNNPSGHQSITARSPEA